MEIQKQLIVAIGGIFPSIAIAVIAKAALTSIGRNPESASKIFVPLILSIAFAEAIAIYTLVAGFIF